MSLLEEIRAEGPSDPEDPARTLRRLCAALLEENRLPPAAVVAARIRFPLDAAIPVHVPRELGWNRIPIVWERRSDPEVQVVAHVRVKRRRRLRAVRLQENPG